MKVTLYAVIKDDQCRWRLSLDIRADMMFWFGNHKDSVRILMLEPTMSFGQALMLMDRLNLLSPNTRAPTHPEQLLQFIQQQASLSKIPLQQPEGNKQGSWLVECDLQQWNAYRVSSEGAGLHIDELTLSKLATVMQGRSLLWEELVRLMEHHELTDAAAEPAAYVQMACLQGLLDLQQGIFMQKSRKPPWFRSVTTYRCHRCGSGSEHMVFTDCNACASLCPYCEKCLNMGRARFCSVVVSCSVKNSHTHGANTTRLQEFNTWNEYIKPWGLSEIQAEASEQALLFLTGDNKQESGQALLAAAPRQFLIWAVTGAGKTEMIFPLIHYTVANGGRVVVATPRRDVVLELKPRIEKAFTGIPVVTLYGGSEQRWNTGTITIATTHQLLRFDKAFDLVIIDELDAFPYHNNPMLEYAARKVCAAGGATILLSATPRSQLQKMVNRRQLPHVKVAARYHRQPLPVPILTTTVPLQKQLNQSALPTKLKDKLSASIHRGAQIFVFVPKIQMVEPFIQLLRLSFPQVSINGTSSKDENRAQKVSHFRQSQVQMLVTTTILERGVTIPKSDVFIMDADAPIFDCAALVQMAGRAGRSADDPAGNVFFAAKERTRAQMEAIRQIKKMNALAKKKGYLIKRG